MVHLPYLSGVTPLSSRVEWPCKAELNLKGYDESVKVGKLDAIRFDDSSRRVRMTLDAASYFLVPLPSTGQSLFKFAAV